MNTAKNALIQGIDRHLESMDVRELEMVLRFIHKLKDFRKV